MLRYVKMGKRKYASTPSTRKRSRKAPKALARRRRKRNYKAAYKLSRPFKQVLNKFLASKEETHFNTVDIDRDFIQQYPIKTHTVYGMYRLLPLVEQVGTVTVGHPQGQPDNIESRSGVKIKLKSMTLHLQIRLNPTYTGLDVTAGPEDCIGIYYKVYVLSCKAEASYSDVVKDWFGPNGLNTQGLQIELLKQGAEPTQWDALTEHAHLPINSNVFTTHAVRSGYLNKGESSHQQGTPAATHYPSACVNLRIPLKVKSKVLRYAAPDSTYPANFDPFVVVCWKSQNGYSFIQHYPQVPTFVQICGSCTTSWDDMD